jgi:hypothetical protein
MQLRRVVSGRAAAVWLWILCLCAGAPVPAATGQAPALQAPAASRIDGDTLTADLRTIAAPELEGRLTGSAGGRRARALIGERFARLGLLPIDGSFEQRFSFSEKRSDGVREFPDAANVIGLLPGTAEPRTYLVVGAHYDHLGMVDGRVFPGADDNASGVAALLAIAGWLGHHPPPASILFVAFDGEEQGLQGSKYFVANPPVPLDRITAMINMDMIGRGDAGTLFAAGTHPNPKLRPAVEAAGAGKRLKVAFGHDQPPARAGGQQDWTNSSDHGPFHRAGIPYLYFGVEDHADYHKPTDTADRIPRDFYLEATAVILDTVLRVAEGVGK